jgi:hypothetical protein
VWGAFFIGLGLTNQHTLVFYAVPLIIWAMYLLPSLMRVAVFLKMCAAGLVGLLPYAYLPLASMRMPAATWGDQSSFQGDFSTLFPNPFFFRSRLSLLSR